MKKSVQGLVLVLCLISGAMTTRAQHSPDHSQHHDEVNKRGDKVMGFSHEKTTHHFRLKSDGGAIEVTANDPNDVESAAMIRRHLRHISQKFAAGDFTAPMLIHSQTPPDVPVMQKLKARIKYEFEESEHGARVRIVTSDAKARAAIHKFLRFQIRDHQTGDSGEIEKQ